MKQYSNIRGFLISLIRYVGNGYKECQITYIPKSKEDKKRSILKKIEKKYNTNLTQGQRQYRRVKGLCNYAALNFNNIIILLRTPGKSEYNSEKWENIINKEIQFNNLLSYKLYKDERGKLTIRLSKDSLRAFNYYIEASIKSKNIKNFNQAITTLYKLHKVVRYRGFMLQIKQILKRANELQKKHGTNFKTPTFFS